MQKNYGASPQSSYIDYAKLFSYLGKFIAGSPYAQDNSASNGAVNPMSSSTALSARKQWRKQAATSNTWQAAQI